MQIKGVKKLTAICVLASTMAIAGCTHHRIPSTTDINDLANLSPGDVDLVKGIGGIRLTALRDTALSLGARAGLAWRAEQLNAMLSSQARSLERVFNFNAIMLEDSVLPPVLTEGRKTLNLANSSTIRLADRVYIIEQQARFVTLPPTWRDYLWLNFGTPELPDRTLLPKDADERVVWKRYIQQGWQAGIEQANTIYYENLGRVKRDYNGMILYRTLLAQNIVSAPFVAKTDFGVTGGGDNLNINDRLLRITALPSLNADSEEWKTEITTYAD